MAEEEAKATMRNVRFLNQHLHEVFNNRSLEAIKGARRKEEYKELVRGYIVAASRPPEDPPVPDYTEAFKEASIAQLEEAIRMLMERTSELPSGYHLETLLTAARQALNKEAAEDTVSCWTRKCFPRDEPKTGTRRPMNEARERTGGRRDTRKAQRRRDYARVQTLWRTDVRRAAKEVLDGGRKQMKHSLEQLKEFWAPLCTRESHVCPRQCGKLTSPTAEGHIMDQPVTTEEVEATRLACRTAAGPDRITARQWKAVPPVVVALLYNLFLLRRRIPTDILRSRTIFIPKNDDPDGPHDYRPISIASIILRQFHRILASRFQTLEITDKRQRASIPADGVAENVAILDATIATAHSTLREVHVATLDISKAFDSLNHGAVACTLRGRGFPALFIEYLEYTYAHAETVFQVGNQATPPVRVRRGVRQGDPLSPLIFNVAIDEILSAIPEQVGFSLGSAKVTCLAFADDLIAVSSTKAGLQATLDALYTTARDLGLNFNSKKSTVLSLVPDGKTKRMKVVTDAGFSVGGNQLPHITSISTWRYLGVTFDPRGLATIEMDVAEGLSRITKAPLKPQQRLALLKTHFIPRFTHGLTLGNVTRGRLDQLDRQIRRSVREWLRLPPDVTTAYFHASEREGGLGISALSTTIPSLTYRRLHRMGSSLYPVAQAAARTPRAQKKLRWAALALSAQGLPLAATPDDLKKHWAGKLHQSVDGSELRASSACDESTDWISKRSDGIPGRDFIQHIRTHINALPTRVRTSRGQRRNNLAIMCRAGCGVTETAAHVIQGCHRTHGGRIRRHDAIAATLAAALTRKGWLIHQEPRLITQEGLRKPDILAVKDGSAVVIDAQVVSGSILPDDNHRRKVAKYKDCAGLVMAAAEKAHVAASKVEITSCTITWRGVWSRRARDDLVRIGVAPSVLGGLTTRVLQGSHTNFSRFSKMTTTRKGFPD